MPRLPTLLVVVGVWAAIYLPALGGFEIRGEEGRRILPAVAMLESGDYVVPQVGGEAYLRKPPLINWLIAGSFKIFGIRNEWTARAPSVLCVLAVAIAFVTFARTSLGPTGSKIAALIWLTNLGMLGKGRLIEIEAIYVSLSALAMIFWLSWWQEKRSPWLTWIVPWIFLGLGWLAKGPAHLVFFYAMVVAVLWQSKQWRALFHPAHFFGILLMMSMFAAWAIPFLRMNPSAKVMEKWSLQFTGRVTGEFFHFHVWILTIPRALAYFLPWLLLVPLIRFSKFEDTGAGKLARALLWAAAVPLIVISLIPGAAPRYTLPILTPFCWLLGMAFAQNAFAEPTWLRLHHGQRRLSSPAGLSCKVLVPLFVGLAMAVGVIGFPAASVVMKHRQKVKNIADKINAAVPASETLYAVDPKYQPFFFYMHSPVKYVGSIEEVPHDARYFLGRPRHEQDALTSEQWAPRSARSVLRVTDYRNQTMILFGIDPPQNRSN
jgi:4-amino-4-deoxy-L-arabinose transferase-like glycosyltransferase